MNIIQGLSKCNRCDNKADAKEGNTLLCTRCWFKMYAKHETPSALQSRVERMASPPALTKTL